MGRKIYLSPDMDRIYSYTFSHTPTYLNHVIGIDESRQNSIVFILYYDNTKTWYNYDDDKAFVNKFRGEIKSKYKLRHIRKMCDCHISMSTG